MPWIGSDTYQTDSTNVATTSGGSMLPFVVPALIGAAASVGGAVLQNEQARKSSAKQMAFQERMSSTSHQREVQDLRAAGLNPILSATGGPGASTPSGSYAPVVGADVAGAASSAVSAMLKEAELENIKAQTEAHKANAAKADEDAKTVDALRPGLVAGQNAQIVSTLFGTERGTKMLPGELNQQHINYLELEERIRTQRQQQRSGYAQEKLTDEEARLARQRFEGVGASAKAQAKIDEALSNSDIGVVLRLIERVLGSFPSGIFAPGGAGRK